MGIWFSLPSVGEILDAANWAALLAVIPHAGQRSGEFYPAELIPWVLSVALAGQLQQVQVCAVYRVEMGEILQVRTRMRRAEESPEGHGG